jgi:ribosomal protein S18 acetylase RimI-like enzyme
VVVIRPATREDATAIAQMHTVRITEGFLPTLGTPFLRRLYRRVVASPDAFAFVADDDGRVVGFVAAALDVGALYRVFLVRDGVVAGIAAAPRLARSWRRVLETLRYPTSTAELPRAEILAVCVAADAGGRGIGRTLVETAVGELDRRGVETVKVVTGAGNDPAIAMYRACGFEIAERMRVHDDVESVLLVRRAGAHDPRGATR